MTPAPIVLSAIIFGALVRPSATRILCEDDAICTQQYRNGSVCVDGSCSNPFTSGCLRRLGEGTRPKLRTCNSDDPPGAANASICAPSPFDYAEIRILNQDFESGMLSSWIMQILLSEFLGVPATIETGSPGLRGFNFYDPNNEFDYGTMAYDYDALRTALEYGDCRNAPPNVTCANIMPEAWNGQNQVMEAAEVEGLIETPSRTGGIVKYSWYIPLFTANKDPSLMSSFGMSIAQPNSQFLTQMLQAEPNRRKMADTFKRPFTWKNYCEKFTPDYCAAPDAVAQRAPKDESEEVRYFASGLFTGFFNATEENDCDLHPSTCTGHIANVICQWSTFAVPQAHYLNIPVQSNGPEIAGGYSYFRMLEIWDAANATQSDVLFYWYTPDPFLQSYVGTDAEFVPIYLPGPTLECTEHRVSEEQRCSKDPADRIGDEIGSCDSDSHTPMKLLVANLFPDTYAIDKPSRSPAYDTIKSLSVSDLEMDRIFTLWYERDTDRWNYDAREAVCQWTAENIKQLEGFIPRGYPRSIREGSSYDQAYLFAATAVGALTAALTILTCAATWFYRKKKVMVYAQVTFLYLLLCGLIFVSIGAVLVSIQPSKATCVSSQWFIVLGYSLVLVPLVVKVAALNKLFQSATRMERVKVDIKHLYLTVGAFLAAVIIFLAVWTVIDPRTSQKERILTDEKNDEGGLVVEVSYSCASQSPVWLIIVAVYQLLLMICATVLAFQSRKIVQEFNESAKLAVVIYSHFIFVVLLVLTWVFSSDLASNTAAAITSFLLSIDSLAMLGIYFVPKIWVARHPGTRSASGMDLRRGFAMRRISGGVLRTLRKASEQASNAAKF